MATLEGNRKIAAIRGSDWREKLVKGRLDSQLHPTRIKILRAQKLVSQADLAKAIAVSLSTYGSIERGVRTVKKETASRLAKELGASVSSLFTQAHDGKFIALRLK